MLFKHRPTCRVLCGALAQLWLIATLSCGGTPPPVTEPDTPTPTAAAKSATSDVIDTKPTSKPTLDDSTAPPPSEAECRALLAHVVELANGAHTQTVAPEHAPTPAQLVSIQERMAPEFVPMCQRLDRTEFECHMQADSREALMACAPE